MNKIETAKSERPEVRSPWLARASWLLIVIALGTSLTMWRWSGGAPVVTADTWWYAHSALQYAGASDAEAARRASLLICVERHPNSPTAANNPRCNTYKPIQSPRYARIFTTRPLYPLVVAPLIEPLGLGTALRVVTLFCCVAIALLVAYCVQRQSASFLAGLASAIAVFVLPSGFWITRLSAEAPMAVGLMVVVLAFVTLEHSLGKGFTIQLIGLGITFLAKPANGIAVAALLVGLGLWLLAKRRTDRRTGLSLICAGGVAIAAWAVLGLFVRLPGLLDTIQDMATNHFTRPDIRSPWHYLVSKNISLSAYLAHHLVGQAGPILAGVAGIAALVYVQGTRAVSWLLVAASGVAAVAVHPLTTEYPRLLVPMWLAVAAGLAFAVGRLTLTVRAHSSR